MPSEMPSKCGIQRTGLYTKGRPGETGRDPRRRSSRAGSDPLAANTLKSLSPNF